MTSNLVPDLAPARLGSRHALAAGFLGWTLDAFDFFTVILLFPVLMAHFGVSRRALAGAITLTLAMRPVGALLFGLLADRFGRRIPLMANVIYFSAIEVLCGFSPNFPVFLVLRGLFGIGMGGEWGVGAALALEEAPRRRRGLFSGMLQSGYSIGYLLAALAARFVLPTLGWRAMFWVGGLPAMLALYVRWKVHEPQAWRQNRPHSVQSIFAIVARSGKLALYLILLMSLMNCFSHGSQDLYPDFLGTVHHIAANTIAWLVVLYNIGAILGAIAFGFLSEAIGRRRSMLLALTAALAVIPAWAFGHSLAVLASGAFFLQVGVQGAWGSIPAYLNEMAPDAVRGLLPGVVYQLGVLIAAPTNNILTALSDRWGYADALAGFLVLVLLILALTLSLGPERHGRDFLKTAVGESAP